MTPFDPTQNDAPPCYRVEVDVRVPIRLTILTDNPDWHDADLICEALRRITNWVRALPENARHDVVVGWRWRFEVDDYRDVDAIHVEQVE